MIEIRGLHKRFGRLEALRGLDLEIQRGRVTSIVGPNSAGKTTLIKCILGLVHPDDGRITVNGHALNGDWSYRRDIGYMPQQAHFPDNLTAREIIRMVADIRGEPDRAEEASARLFDLGGEIDKPFRTLSGGTRQKVSALIAFMFVPETLILDEPTAGLDPLASSALKDRILQERVNGRTIILTSHIMSELEDLSDDIVFLLEGKVLYKGQVAALKEMAGESRLERAVANLLRDSRKSSNGVSTENEKKWRAA